MPKINTLSNNFGKWVPTKYITLYIQAIVCYVLNTFDEVLPEEISQSDSPKQMWVAEALVPQLSQIPAIQKYTEIYGNTKFNF